MTSWSERLAMNVFLPFAQTRFWGPGSRGRRLRLPVAALGGLTLAMLALASVHVEASGSAGYRIGPKDLLEIKVFEVPELNIERRVSEEGTINLPLIGDVPVQGLTDVELADRLKALLESKYVQRASVAVQVREFRSKPISVLGAVRQPGNLAFSGRWTLLEVLSAAGGLGDAHGEKIYVLRRADNGLSDQIAIDVDDLMVRADPDANIPIFANDLINVPARVELTIFCLGEVAHPGGVVFQSTERITLLTAIARAGGLTDRASRKIQVQRRDRNGRDVQLDVDYKRIVAGKEPDFPLQSGDVVIVKESLF
jgi:polysaccharide biosynthesis/export protein